MDEFKGFGPRRSSGPAAAELAAAVSPLAEIARRDVRATRLYEEVATFFATMTAPGEGRVTDAMDVTLAPNGAIAAFTGVIQADLMQPPITRICLVDLNAGTSMIRPAPCGSDKLPHWSSDGRLAFLSDRSEPGNYCLYVADESMSPARAAPAVDGVCEFLQWSPDGRRILLGVAGFGADLPGAQGGATTLRGSDASVSWAPAIETADAEHRWRRLYIYEVAADVMRVVSPPRLNVWEAVWLGDGQVAAVVSESHTEDSWYSSKLALLDIASGASRVIHVPQDQIGYPAASASGKHLAWIDAVCSDRLLVAGALRVMDLPGGSLHEVDTLQVDVTHAGWRDERHLTYVGQRGLETVVGEYDAGSRRCQEIWASAERTFAGWQPSMCPLREPGCVAIAEAYGVAPEVAVIRAGTYRSVHSFGTAALQVEEFEPGQIEPVAWSARDGLEMQGWLVRPGGAGPAPVVMDIHGGPVWSHRNRWCGRMRGAKVLADHGVASFYPNPRGSSGRGLEFARLVKGDLGGEDAHDCLLGLDALVAQGVADVARLGVTGISYGGFLSAWLITQDARFAAAAPISPICNWYSQHRTSQIGFFDASFMKGRHDTPGGHYFERSPVMFAHRACAPTLLMTGATDQNTPATQALEFHRSLIEHGVQSVLVTYPNAGHGVRSFPEVIDATTRYVGWMLHHLA